MKDEKNFGNEVQKHMIILNPIYGPTGITYQTRKEDSLNTSYEIKSTEEKQ
jgi:hypothetical protein